ncbi:MAG: alkaline phosphatase family protein [Myxococcales bacterium]|nr:hypothetical protein [Myxococcales bacterium]HIK83808.1 hypothetical protein [Myxococcales bacterium]
MRAILFIGCVLIALGCATPTLRDQRSLTADMIPDDGGAAMRDSGPPRRVILITVAGLESADFLNGWGRTASEGDAVRMPNLARLGRQGTIGIQVHPPSPSSTYASHATIATGRLPSSHGVIADSTLDREGARDLPFWDSRLLQGDAIWDAAIGGGVLALGWPSTLGARIEWIVPDGSPDASSQTWLEFINRQTSPSLMQALEEMAALAMQVPNDDGEEKGARDPATWPTPSEKDTAFVDLACRLSETERDPRLWLIRLSQTAYVKAISGSGSLDAGAALARVDSEIGRLIGCLDLAGRLADTAIFVTGDVVYRAVHTQVDPNVTLVNHDLIGRDPRSSLGVRSWRALLRSNGRSAYLYARDGESALEARKWLEEAADATDAFEVVSALELAESDSDPQAWFGLAANPGFVFGNGLSKPMLRPSRLRASAGALPFRDPIDSSVGFVAWGRGIRPQIRVPSMDLADIAPTIATLLGLRFDSEFDGKPVIGILRAAVAPQPRTGPKRLGAGTDGDADRVLREMRGGRELGQD